MPDPVITLLRTSGRAPRVLAIEAEDWFHVCEQDDYSDWRHPWELDPDHPRVDGLPPLLRAVHFASLRRLPARFDRWLARDRCVALEDVIPSLEPV